MAVVRGGPCAPARADVDVRCADAERLATAATAAQQRLREARREHAQITRLRDADSRSRDRRVLNDEKNTARDEYRAAVKLATEPGAIEGAAAAWLRRLDELNRAARVADGRADAVANRVSQLERSLPGMELAADAARIAAEAANVACLDARRTLGLCEEDAQRSGVGVPARVAVSGAPTPWSTRAQTGYPPAHPAVPVAAAPPAPAFDRASAASAAAALMRGNRETMVGLSQRLAEETGVEAGRLQLLLLELREQIAARTLEEGMLGFHEGHPFWSQFTLDGARCVVTTLASLGFRFDGRDAWVDGRSPQIRDLALALSYCGLDPRSLRRPAGQAALDGLWQGATLRAEEFLLSQAPELALPQLTTLLGPRAGRLSELWDIWSRLRPLLARATG
jgi:hypothetical protein